MTSLPRTLNLRDMTFLTVGSVIGSGIFLVPGAVLRQVDGLILPAMLVWLTGGLVSLLGALTYCELASLLDLALYGRGRCGKPGDRGSVMKPLFLLLLATTSIVAHQTTDSPNASRPATSLYSRLSLAQVNQHRQAKPKAAPARWRALIGEYGSDNDVLYILEKDGRLCALFKRVELEPLEPVSGNIFKFASGTRQGQKVIFIRDAAGRVTQVQVDSIAFKRRQIGPEEGAVQLRVTPLRPVPELLREARTAAPPAEAGDFREPELLELTKLDPTIRLDIRYATTNNLFGTVFYAQPRAFMQRPAAEALVRVNRTLKSLGYGLLIHDAYRPWYVTKVFWDATPDEKKLFVADPSKGSRHNRGAAVDLTLYELKTGKPVEMVSTYDETTDRASPDYPGGTSLQRWHRDLLRSVMEGEGFTVYEAEWWHFDYKDWQKYRIGNEPFERIGSDRN